MADMDAMHDRGLVSLNDGGWAVAEGEPDVRGWAVTTGDRRRVGEVRDLLADPTAGKVRYVTVEADEPLVAGASDARTTRVPIERVRLHEGDRSVLIDGDLFDGQGADDAMNSGAGDGTSSQAAASSLAGASSMGTARQPWTDEQVRLTRAGEELRVGTRPVTAGEVVVSKHVETEHVREPVSVRRERVEVERRPVSGEGASGDVQIGEQEIRVPIVEEEVVVEKRAVVREELVISKHTDVQQETVEADVREERIDVDRIDEQGGRREGRPHHG